MAREYSIWKATVAALQFWTADLKAHVLSSTTEQVYKAFFYSTSAHLLCQESDVILLGCFMITLNEAFKSKLPLDDEGYESSSKNLNISTPLRRTSKIHHVSSVKNASFDPEPEYTIQHPTSKCTFNALVNQEEDKEEEDFPTVSLDDEHWDMEEIPDRHLCIHEHSILHELCPYPCPYSDYTTSSYYDSLDSSDISEFEDLMTTSSDEDVPAFDEVGY